MAIQAWAGVWALSAVLATGSTAPRLYARGTRHISVADSTVTIVDELVRVRGGVVHQEWTGKLDGNDYPVQGVEVYLTSAYRQIDDHTIELRQKVDGRTVVFATMMLSADGRTMTTTTTDGVTTAKTVYTKR
jgi:Tfp pilus assembly protein PilW